MPDHDARRRNIASRPSHRRRPTGRHLEILQPGTRTECRRTMGARPTRHRTRRIERAASSPRPPIRPRHLHRQPSHHRRHDGQQLQRRTIRPLRQDHRSCNRTRSSALRRIHRPVPRTKRRRTPTQMFRRISRSPVLPNRSTHRRRVRRRSRQTIPQSTPTRRRLQSRRVHQTRQTLQSCQADGRLRRHARHRARGQTQPRPSTESQGRPSDSVHRTPRSARSHANHPPPPTLRRRSNGPLHPRPHPRKHRPRKRPQQLHHR